ncbi:MAG TPA: dethiobiotin synthase [Tepidisphaeraceae bacterium]|jgi:dethiobiotin synthetase
MLPAVTIPGIFVTGTDTGVGKTLIAAGIADWFRRQGGKGRAAARIGVFKPVATGCAKRREGLVSEDAEFLALCADSSHSLDEICPQRFAEPLAPSVAAERARQPLDWDAIERSLRAIEADSEVLIVEGVGGVMVPLDARHTVLEMIQWLRLPVVVVARPNLGTINHTLLTVDALRRAGATVAGVVINRYPPEMASIAEETNPRLIEKWGKLSVLSIVPEEKVIPAAGIPPGVAAAMDLVDWERIARRGA